MMMRTLVPYQYRRTFCPNDLTSTSHPVKEGVSYGETLVLYILRRRRYAISSSIADMRPSAKRVDKNDEDMKI